MKWISVKDELPKNFDEVLVKTDCKDCPILPATYLNKFILQTLVQCDHHYEGDQKFVWLKMAVEEEVDGYRDRIVEWALIPKGEIK